MAALDRPSSQRICTSNLEQVADQAASSSSCTANAKQKLRRHHRYRMPVPIPITAIADTNVLDSTAERHDSIFGVIRPRGGQQRAISHVVGSEHGFTFDWSRPDAAQPWFTRAQADNEARNERGFFSTPTARNEGVAATTRPPARCNPYCTGPGRASPSARRPDVSSASAAPSPIAVSPNESAARRSSNHTHRSGGRGSRPHEHGGLSDCSVSGEYR